VKSSLIRKRCGFSFPSDAGNCNRVNVFNDCGTCVRPAFLSTSGVTPCLCVLLLPYLLSGCRFFFGLSFLFFFVCFWFGVWGSGASFESFSFTSLCLFPVSPSNCRRPWLSLESARPTRCWLPHPNAITFFRSKMPSRPFLTIKTRLPFPHLAKSSSFFSLPPSYLQNEPSPPRLAFCDNLEYVSARTCCVDRVTLPSIGLILCDFPIEGSIFI